MTDIRQVEQQLPLSPAGPEAGGMFVIVMVLVCSVAITKVAPEISWTIKLPVLALVLFVMFKHPGKAILVMLCGIGWLIGSY